MIGWRYRKMQLVLLFVIFQTHNFVDPSRHVTQLEQVLEIININELE